MPELFRLYLDQCLRVNVSKVFKSEGFDVVRASEIGQSHADVSEILQHAIAENKILVTLDGH